MTGRARTWLVQLAGDLPGIVTATLIALALPAAVLALLLSKVPLP